MCHATEIIVRLFSVSKDFTFDFIEGGNMLIRIIPNIFAPLVALLFCNCLLAEEIVFSSTAKSEAHSMVDSTKSYPLSPNTETKISVTDPLWFEGEDSLPILVIPISGKTNSVKLDPPKLSSVVRLQSQKQINKSLSLIMAEVSEIQAMLRKRQLTQSRLKLQSLMNEFPDVSFLKFILANQFLIEGERKEALRFAEEALSQNPTYAEGKTFVLRLKGEAK